MAHWLTSFRVLICGRITIGKSDRCRELTFSIARDTELTKKKVPMAARVMAGVGECLIKGGATGLMAILSEGRFDFEKQGPGLSS